MLGEANDALLAVLDRYGRWLDLFREAVDALFSGPCAEDAKARATRIAAVMQHHIANDLTSRTVVGAGEA